ncbi:MAG: Acetylglutamate kinase [Planctomycetes bacterium ADurb.Bin126]|nr:MAG: Acetylglutamate kinase [Planctomycetes bacterium ADurb.Bin126]HOD79818.1 acetylglutamate kinase [Phycisphaerae bacterium]HQL72826.1 acetylglutamate kinase [Phycisphaerae bacterium]
MEEAIAKAQTLVEALGYIQRFSDKIIVVKMGGSVMDDERAMSDIMTDIVFMNTVGMRPVIIHGGGKAINNAMEARGLQVEFVQGRRYTDQRTLTVVEHVLCNEINRQLVNMIEAMGSSAMGLHTLSSTVLFGEKLFLESEGRKIDLGFVGRVTSVNARLIELLCQADTVPVIAPLARDRTGTKLNCNADTAAGEVAAALKAEKFVVVSDTHGIRRDPKDPASLIAQVSEAEIRAMIQDGTISSGMLPKVEACLRALDGGVQRTHIIDGRFPHSLLLEIFSDGGVGTLIQK